VSPFTAARQLPRGAAGDVTSFMTFCQKAGIELVATIEGFSMSPGLTPGTRVRLRPVEPSALRLNDVIAFQSNTGRLIAHRVVHLGRSAASRGYLLTRGDAMLLNDVPVSLASIVGVVSAKRRGADWVPLEPARRRGSKQVISRVFTAIVGPLFDLSPGAATRMIRWTGRACALIRALRAA
jgi:hypothetical protein